MNYQGSAFWSSFGVRFGLGGASTIDKLLVRDDCTLEQLLEEESLLNECKYDNPVLIDFLSRPDVVRKMVDYIVLRPEDDTDQRKQKYPYLVSEIFNSEMPTIVTTLFEEPDVLPKLFSILDEPPPLDPSRVAYFRKVVFVLVQTKYEALLRWLKSAKNIVHKMIEHIGLYSLMELLIMVGWDDAFGQVNDTQWMFKEGVIPKLLAKLAPEYENEPDVHANAARALILIVQKAPPGKHNWLITHLQTSAMMDVLFAHMLSGSQSSLLHCLSIVTMLVQRASMQQREYLVDGNDNTEWELAVPFSMCLKHLERLHSILKSEPNDQYDSPIGATPVLGPIRMEAVRLFSLLFQCQSKELVDELIRLDVLSTLLDLFFLYQWNNNLHGFVESVVLYILESGNADLVVLLFEKANIIGRLLDGYKVGIEEENYDPKASPPRARKFRAGYMGHVLRIANSMANCKESDVLQYTDLDDGFKAFVDECVHHENVRQSHLLGGFRPKLPSEDDDEGDADGQDYTTEDYKDEDWDNREDAMKLPDFLATFAMELGGGDDEDYNWPDNVRGDDDDEDSSSSSDEDNMDDVQGDGFLVFTPQNQYYSDSSEEDDDDDDDDDDDAALPLPPTPPGPEDTQTRSPRRSTSPVGDNQSTTENGVGKLADALANLDVSKLSRQQDDGDDNDGTQQTTTTKQEDTATTTGAAANTTSGAPKETDTDISVVDGVGFSYKDRVRRGSEFNDVQFWRPTMHMNLDDLEEL